MSQQPRTRVDNTRLSDYRRVHEVLASPTPATWVCTGASTTQGALHTGVHKGYVQHFEERVRWELGRLTDFVVNTGVSGQGVDEILDDFGHRVARFEPAVVTALVGSNESVRGPLGQGWHRCNLARLVDEVRALGAVPVLLTPCPIDRAADEAHRDLPPYARISRDVAAAKDVILVDLETEWRSWGAAVTADWRNDAIHANARGHLMIARKLFADLGILDPGSQTGILEV
ncbi:MAG: SGNH/GDSL hydrolase family protein [Stackebrandtia sp.]